MIPDRLSYLGDIINELKKMWPDNRTINIVCHGHSVPAGYFATPYINSLSSYPQLLKNILCERFPFASVNVIVTAIGGENSLLGSNRFEKDVLCHKPDVVTIDYGLNDRRTDPKELTVSAWTKMINKAKDRGAKVILLTPSLDMSYYMRDDKEKDDWDRLTKQDELIKKLAVMNNVGICDSFGAFMKYIAAGGEITDLLSSKNHPNRLGHEMIANELSKWFAAG